jgi:hypothetical protein
MLNDDKMHEKAIAFSQGRGGYMDDVRDRRDRVLSNLSFWGFIIALLMTSVFYVHVIKEFLTNGTVSDSFVFPIISSMYAIVKGVLLYRQKKSISVELSRAPVYRRETLRHRKRDFAEDFVCVLFLLSIILFCVWFLQHQSNNNLTDPLLKVLVVVFLLLLSLQGLLYIYWGHGPKMTVALFLRSLNVSYPDRFLIDESDFLLNDISEACILAADDPKMKQYLFAEAPKHKVFFLSRGPTLCAGNQVMDLKLRNGRHVLIETDDADNFLAALRRCGVGG